MTISVFGLGYVGCVSLGCLASDTNKIIGVDIEDYKVNSINKGKPTIIENGIGELILKNFNEGNISATKDHDYAVQNSDISIICVGTPSLDSGQLNHKYIFNTAMQIGKSLKNKNKFHVCVIRSTVYPGTNIKFGEIIEKYSNKKRNLDFAVVSNPEFLREGSAVSDFKNPPITVLGSDNKKAINILKELYSEINADFKIVDTKVAEIIKYVNNSYHALKITFANEIGNICKKLLIDSHDVMELFCEDKVLNISSAYLKPGFAYGGSCLPKDLKGLHTIARDNYLQSPVLESIEDSNSFQKQIALKMISETKKSKIGFVSISFKSGTDDLRYSPSVEIIEQLIGKGKTVHIYDKNVSLSKIFGSNKNYIDDKLPHISSLLVDDFEDLVKKSDVLVFPNKPDSEIKLNLPEDKIIIDFARIDNLKDHSNYYGIAW